MALTALAGNCDQDLNKGTTGGLNMATAACFGLVQPCRRPGSLGCQLLLRYTLQPEADTSSQGCQSCLICNSLQSAAY